MIALDPNNQDKMIQIIIDILGINVKDSPLLEFLLERHSLIDYAQKALENADFFGAANIFKKIAEKCIEIGDDRVCKEFYEKSKKLMQITSSQNI